jgi:hypothetical protein
VAGLRKSELHSLIRDALGDKVKSHGSVEAVPFVVQPDGLVKLAMWAYTVTSPPGGRHPLESKIQLILPGQRKGERADFNPPDDDTFMILIGVKPEEEIFVLWDAYKHRAFPHSKNVQVKAGPLLDAQTFGIGRTTRRLASGDECIIAARPDHLFEALRERIAT